jgi:hypothetical protein
MAFESRGNRHYFYYYERLPGGGVHKLYGGAGLVGQLVAEELESRREERQVRRQAERAQLDQLARLEALVKAAHQAVERIAAASLYAAGYYRHHGSEWRRNGPARSRRTAR